MGGTLEVTSTVGSGSAFVARLPLPPATQVPGGSPADRAGTRREESRSTATTSG